MSSTSSAPQTGRLAWSLRQHRVAVAVVALLILLITGLAVARVVSAPTEHTATATVLGTDLAHDPAGLARLAETLAAEPLVLESAIAAENLPYTPESLAEEHSEVRPLEDNVLILIDGIDTDPALAVRAANGVAEALTAELNRAGPGVGEFRILTRATAAEPGDARPTVLLYVLAGLVAMVAAVLATIGLLNSVRRPVPSAADAADVTGHPVLAVIDGREQDTDDSRSPYQALADALTGNGVQRVLVLAPNGDGKLAEGVAAALRGVLDGVPPGRHAGLAVSAASAPQDGISSVPVPAGAKAVVLAPEGVSAEALRTATHRVRPEEVAGLVYVASPRRMRRPAQRRPRASGAENA